MSVKASSKTYYLGVDGGGSKCKAIVYTADRGILGSGLSGSANAHQDLSLAKKSILEATEKAIANAGLSVEIISELIAGIGLAGVNLSGPYQSIVNWKAPFKRHYVLTDLEAASIGAHRGGNGAVVIAGTGSCGFVTVDGRSLTVGAHGFPHGDKGSGAWIGLQAVEHCLLAADHMREPGLLCEAIQTKDPGALVQEIGCRSPGAYARLAPHVFDAADKGDIVARNILAEAGDYLSHVAFKLLEFQPPRLSFIGGVSKKILPWLKPELRDQILPALEPPEMGAVLFAQQCEQKHQQEKN